MDIAHVGFEFAVAGQLVLLAYIWRKFRAAPRMSCCSGGGCCNGSIFEDALRRLGPMFVCTKWHTTQVLSWGPVAPCPCRWRARAQEGGTQRRCALVPAHVRQLGMFRQGRSALAPPRAEEVFLISCALGGASLQCLRLALSGQETNTCARAHMFGIFRVMHCAGGLPGTSAQTIETWRAHSAVRSDIRTHVALIDKSCRAAMRSMLAFAAVAMCAFVAILLGPRSNGTCVYGDVGVTFGDPACEQADHCPQRLAFVRFEAQTPGRANRFDGCGEFVCLRALAVVVAAIGRRVRVAAARRGGGPPNAGVKRQRELH